VEDFAAAVASRLRRSASISAKQGKERQRGRTTEVEEVGADLDGGDGGGTSAVRTGISIQVLRLPQLLRNPHR
jgi:hypothetical protein